MEESPTISPAKEDSTAEKSGEYSTSGEAKPDESGAPTGIAAMAAAAAQKKNDAKAATGAPMGIAAMAAAAAQKKNEAKAAANDSAIDAGSSSLPGSSIDTDSASKGPDVTKPPQPAAEKSAVIQYLCSACGEKLEKEHFSKNQLSKVKKNQNGRCKQCIESSG